MITLIITIIINLKQKNQNLNQKKNFFSITTNYLIIKNVNYFTRPSLIIINHYLISMKIIYYYYYPNAPLNHYYNKVQLNLNSALHTHEYSRKQYYVAVQSLQVSKYPVIHRNSPNQPHVPQHISVFYAMIRLLKLKFHNSAPCTNLIIYIYFLKLPFQYEKLFNHAQHHRFLDCAECLRQNLHESFL